MDPDTEEEYWVLVPDDLPLGVRVPKTGSGVFAVTAMIALSLGVLIGILAVVRRDKRIYQIRH
jgi:hypothetical protein